MLESYAYDAKTGSKGEHIDGKYYYGEKLKKKHYADAIAAAIDDKEKLNLILKFLELV